MEGRMLKINFNKSGSGSYTPKLSLPIIDCRDMGIVPEDRKTNYYYNEENKIMILSKKKIKNIKFEIEYEE